MNTQPSPSIDVGRALAEVQCDERKHQLLNLYLLSSTVENARRKWGIEKESDATDEQYPLLSSNQ